MQKYRERLADQQEIVAALADIVIEIYRHGIRPAARAEIRRRARRGFLRRHCRRGAVLLHDGAARIEASARTALAASVEGDMLRTQMAVLRRLIKREPVDTIALRRIVADAVVTANRYPFEGR